MTQHANVLSQHAITANFWKLSLPERHERFEAIHTLAPSTAERLAIEWLKHHDMIGEDDIHDTRKMAAEYLSRYSTSDEAYHVLQQVVQQTSHNPPQLRSTSSRAMESIKLRLSTSAHKGI